MMTNPVSGSGDKCAIHHCHRRPPCGCWALACDQYRLGSAVSIKYTQEFRDLVWRRDYVKHVTDSFSYWLHAEMITLWLPWASYYIWIKLALHVSLHFLQWLLENFKLYMWLYLWLTFYFFWTALLCAVLLRSTTLKREESNQIPSRWKGKVMGRILSVSVAHEKQEVGRKIREGLTNGAWCPKRWCWESSLQVERWDWSRRRHLLRCTLT